MRRIILAVMVLAVVIFSNALVFADSGTIQWRYKIRKFVEEDITLGFTDLNGANISSFEINTEKTLSNAQIHLSVVTNKVNGYTLRLSFTPLMDQSGTQFGLYRARVSDIITFEGSEADFRDIVFTELETQSITFPGDTSDDANNMITVYYPISFDFSGYIDDYSAGVYTGTITVEVAAT